MWDFPSSILHSACGVNQIHHSAIVKIGIHIPQLLRTRGIWIHIFTFAEWCIHYYHCPTCIHSHNHHPQHLLLSVYLESLWTLLGCFQLSHPFFSKWKRSLLVLWYFSYHAVYNMLYWTGVDCWWDRADDEEKIHAGNVPSDKPSFACASWQIC